MLFLIDVQAEDPLDDFKTLLNELESYDLSLMEKPKLVALSKADTLIDDDRDTKLTEKFKDLPVQFISSVTGEGLDELINLLWKTIQQRE